VVLVADRLQVLLVGKEVLVLDKDASSAGPLEEWNEFGEVGKLWLGSLQVQVHYSLHGVDSLADLVSGLLPVTHELGVVGVEGVGRPVPGLGSLALALLELVGDVDVVVVEVLEEEYDEEEADEGGQKVFGAFEAASEEHSVFVGVACFFLRYFNLLFRFGVCVCACRVK